MEELKIISAFSSEFQELCTRRGWIDPDVEEFNPLSLFESDPDILKIGEERIYFFSVIEQGVRYVCHSSDDDFGQVHDILTAFWKNLKVSPDQFSMIEGDWDLFNKQEVAIAYRGGQGYTYTLWKVEDISRKIDLESKKTTRTFSSSYLENKRRDFLTQNLRTGNNYKSAKIKL